MYGSHNQRWIPYVWYGMVNINVRELTYEHVNILSPIPEYINSCLGNVHGACKNVFITVYLLCHTQGIETIFIWFLYKETNQIIGIRLEILQRLGVQSSEMRAPIGITGAPLSGPYGILWISQQYCSEKFRGLMIMI